VFREPLQYLVVVMFVGIDIGTSSVKVALVNDYGEVVKEYNTSIDLLIPEQGAAEHNLLEIYRAVFNGVKTVVKGFENRVEALSLSSYLHGVALLGKSMDPLTNIYTHLDTRAGRYQYLVEEMGREVYERTGCPPIFVYPLTKLLWLRDAMKIGRDTKVSFVKDYIIYRFTGSWVLDYGVASGTGLLNIRSLRWDSYVLGISGVDEDMLPQLVEGAKILDYISIPELGLDKVALVPGSFDGALQNIGYSVYEDRAVLNLGSTAVIRILKKDIVVDRDKEMRFFCYYAADGYRVIGAASNNGMTFLEWVRRNIAGDRDWGELSREVVNVKPCSEGVVVFPFIGGERFPYRDPYLRFTVLGIGINHEKKHIVKASFEGVGYILKTIIKALEENNIRLLELHCGGGGCRVGELLKTISNICCKNIVVYEENIAKMASIYGTTVIALKALGYINNIDSAKIEIIDRGRVDTIKPREDLCKTYSKCYELFEELLKKIRQVYRYTYYST